MSGYPPERHVLRDLRFTTRRVTVDHAVVEAPVVPGFRSDRGGVLAGVLACLVDVTGAMVALGAVHPDWTATADLALHARRAIIHGPIVMGARTIRAGRTLVVVGCEIRDGRGEDGPEAGVAAGVATMSFSRIPGAASVIEGRDLAEGIGSTTTMALPDSGLTVPFRDALGLRVVDADGGVVEVDKHDYVRNSFGTVNGGVVAALFDAAAESAGRAATGAPVVTADLQVHYLAQTKAGPARTTADVLRADEHTATLALRLHDMSDGALLAMATAGVALLEAGPR